MQKRLLIIGIILVFTFSLLLTFLFSAKDDVLTCIRLVACFAICLLVHQLKQVKD